MLSLASLALTLYITRQGPRGGTAGLADVGTALLSPAADQAITSSRDAWRAGDHDAAARILRDAAATARAVGTRAAARDAALLDWEELAQSDAPADIATARAAFSAVANAWRPLDATRTQTADPIFGHDGAARLLATRLPRRDATPPDALAVRHLRALLAAAPPSASDMVQTLLGDATDRGGLALVLAAAAELDDPGWIDSGLVRTFEALPRRALLDALYGVATDAAAPDATRPFATYWLGAVADLPVGLMESSGGGTWRRSAFPAQEIVAAWRAVRDLPRDRGYLARVRLADEERAHARYGAGSATREELPRTDANALHGWIRRHVGRCRGCGADNPVPPQWLEADADPVRLLAAELDRPGPPFDLRALANAATVPDALRHSLLTLLAPQDVCAPLWPADRSLPPSGRAWCDVYPPDASVGPYVVAVVWLEFDGSAWRVRRSGVSAPDADRRAVTLAASATPLPFEVRFAAPGLVRSPRGVVSAQLSVDVHRYFDARGSQVQYAAELTSATATSASRQQVGLPPVAADAAVLLRLGSPSMQVVDMRPQAVLCRAFPAAESASIDRTPWGAWVAADIERIAAELRDPDLSPMRESVRQQTLAALVDHCASVPVPEALTVLRQLASRESLRRSHIALRDVQRAALLAGAHEFLDAVCEPTAEGVPGASDAALFRRPPIAGSAAGESDAAYFAALALTTSDVRVRARAESMLLARPPTGECARLLADAVAMGVYRPGAALAALLPAATPRPPDSIAAALAAHPAATATSLLVLLAFLCLGAITLRDRTVRRPIAAATLVALGVVAAALRFETFTWPLVPPALAYGAAALGAARLVRVSRLRLGRCAPWALGVAAAASAVDFLVPRWGEIVAAAAVVVALTSTCRLAFAITVVAVAPDRLAPRRPRTGVSLRAVVAAVACCTLGLPVVMLVARSGTAGWSVGSVLVLVTVLGMGALLAAQLVPALLRSDFGRPRAELPLLFVVAYVLPASLDCLFAALGQARLAHVGFGAAARPVTAAVLIGAAFVLVRLLAAARSRVRAAADQP